MHCNLPRSVGWAAPDQAFVKELRPAATREPLQIPCTTKPAPRGYDALPRAAVAEAMLVPLPYLPDACAWFARLRRLPGAILLDSAQPFCARGRFDLMSALPRIRIRTRGETTTVHEHGTEVLSSTADPFGVLERALATDRPADRTPAGEWPFRGGAIGFFGYGLGRRSARLPPRAAGALPDMQVGIHDWALMQDHDRRRAALLFTERVDAPGRQRVLDCLHGPEPEPEEGLERTGAWRPNMDRAGYARSFERVREYILAGDCYQVNLAQRHSAAVRGDPWATYRRLRERMASPFSAYLECDGAAVLSFSPERFLHLADCRVETRPIKGTARRGGTQAADRRAADWLLASEKDRAENVMIVDLMRNDIGTVCRTGSVHVEHLCALESYANVHHLVSSVTGALAPGASAARLLGNCFPGGSITGAPKIRAMQIIDELEPDPRSVYCGSIGYLSYDGTMDTSIAIRTLVHDGTHLHAWGGGGLTADSACESEYRECLTKIEPLLQGIPAAAG
jgi:para-aminobenzoate synthetase component 1